MISSRSIDVMTKITPYLDATAHGQLNKSLCFRRRFGKVFLGSTSFPKNPRTPAQILQRQKFGEASTAFNLLNFQTRSFYKNRSAMIRQETKPLYMHANLSDKLPAQIPGIPIKTVDSMLIYNPVGTIANNIQFSINGEEDGSADVGCFFWSKLNDGPTTLNPEIGPPGSSISGLTWLPAKFDDGLNLYMMMAWLEYHIGSVLTNQLIFDFWFISRFASTETHRDVQPIYLYSGNWEIFIGLSSSSDPNDPNQFYVRGNNYAYPNQSFNYYLDNPGFTAESLHHLEFIIDGAAPAGQRVRFIFDKNEQGISSIPTDNSFNLSGDWRFVIPQNDTTPGTVDNLKGYGTTQYWEYIRDNQDTEGWTPFPKPGTDITFGSIYDRENIFTPGAPGALALTLKIREIAGRVTEIPFYYAIWVKWTDYNDVSNDSIMRLPKLILQPHETIYLYLANDWSLYDNEQLTHLAATNNV